MLLQWAVLFGTFPLVAMTDCFNVFYPIWVFALYFSMSGHFVLMPGACSRIFGAKYMATTYSLLYLTTVRSAYDSVIRNHTKNNWTMFFLLGTKLTRTRSYRIKLQHQRSFQLGLFLLLRSLCVEFHSFDVYEGQERNLHDANNDLWERLQLLAPSTSLGEGRMAWGWWREPQRCNNTVSNEIVALKGARREWLRPFSICIYSHCTDQTLSINKWNWSYKVLCFGVLWNRLSSNASQLSLIKALSRSGGTGLWFSEVFHASR